MRAFLTPGKDGEVAELTGARQKARQKQILAAMGLKWLERADGWVVVPVSEIDKGAPKDQEPDFSSLK